MEKVILVNEHDDPVGIMEKMEAHQKGLLHRAFSIVIFNDNGKMLLQQRALGKYHSPGLWTNACCSHPAPGEFTMQAAHRRLKEEMGFDTKLIPAFTFTYKAVFENGLTEHEFDHVFFGNYSNGIYPDDSEVKDYKYMEMNALKEDILLNEDQYTSWFKIAFPMLESFLTRRTVEQQR